MEHYPEELRTPPVTLVCLVGCPDLHPAVTAFLHSENPPMNTLALPEFSKISVLSGKKQKDGNDFGATSTGGILKKDWILKHRTKVPSVVAVFFSMDRVAGNPAQWQQVCTDVWDIIEEAKKDRAIILTTHSMEEADILGDRIAIMAKGKLRCIGTSIRLKSRFGTGYIANVSFLSSSAGQAGNVNGNTDFAKIDQVAQVKEFFKSHLNVVPKEENRGFLTFVIPHVKEGLLTKFFAELQDREKEFGISDIQLGLTTLEEVFLNIAKKAELESATAEGSMVTLNLNSGTSIEIPKGARFIVLPGTVTTENSSGLMVEVFWEQDDSGNLCISGHSEETPTPSHIVPVFNEVGSQRSLFGGSTLPVGFVVNPDEIEEH